MDNFIWTTDTHLNRMSKKKKSIFLSNFQDKNLIVAGDIADGPTLKDNLNLLGQSSKNIYFVLGNHDLHYCSFDLKEQMNDLPDNVKYLTQEQPFFLDDYTALIGDDGWYDARYCFPLTNLVFTFDWFLIRDFWMEHNNEHRLMYARELAWESADRLYKKMLICVQNNIQKIILVTHFPPWRQNHLFSFIERFWIPYNTNRFLGDKLAEFSKEYPYIQVSVLSGHTHKESISHHYNIKCHINAPRKIVQL